MECWHSGSGFLVGLVFLNWAAPADIRGTVVDAVSGMPVPSSVSLQKFVSGSWVNVTDPAEMAPAINPESGTLTGGFGWDVAPGPQYRVSVSSFSCTSYTSGALTLPATSIQISLTCADSDADGLPDFIEPITIYDNFTTQYITQPDDPDTDGDTIPDGDDDCDGDSFSNAVELRDYRSDPCDWEAGDGDGEGCTDMEELRADEELGGRRDGRNPWDFFDTDGNKLIDLFGDIFDVANAFGLTPPDPGYSPILDRSAAPPGGDPWDMGARTLLLAMTLCTLVLAVTATLLWPKPEGTSAAGASVAGVAAGDSHTCALTTAGGVKCWGYNFFGQLGNGTTTNSNTPVNVFGLASGITAVATGDYHSCAITTAGGLDDEQQHARRCLRAHLRRRRRLGWGAPHARGEDGGGPQVLGQEQPQPARQRWGGR